LEWEIPTTCEEKNFHHEDKQQWNRLPREAGNLCPWRFSPPEQPGLNSALILLSAGG